MNTLNMENPSTSPVAIANVAPGTPERARDLTEVFDILTHQAYSELGDWTQSIFFFGDGLQRAVTDGIFNLFRPQTWMPNNILRTSFSTLRQTIQVLQLLQPDQASLAWQELRNKLEVFMLVRNLPSTLHLPSDHLPPLPAMVEKAYSVPEFQSLWAVEGLGHYYGDLYWKLNGVPRGLLFEENAHVPEKSLLMLHAGLGMAFADRLLGNLTSEASAEQFRETIRFFLATCENNCRKGYLGAALESLGLITRDFYPDFVQRVDQALRQVGPEFLGFFWHGVGRAMYFSRQYFLPILCTVWTGVGSEASNAPDRLSAMAGLAWGVAMVNLKQPAIVENVVRSYFERSDLAEGFTNGVISSLIMRTDTTPGTAMVEAFYQHSPGDRNLMLAWEQRVAAPSRTALHNYYPVLKQHRALDQVFRYQDLAALVSYLQQQNMGTDSEHGHS
jgi:hypothetical protein